MFVRKSKYEELERKFTAACIYGENVRLMHNRLLTRTKELQVSSSSQFTQDELKSLLSLVHPDKHGNKQSATDATQKILKLLGK